jgi:hypothetical protein
MRAGGVTGFDLEADDSEKEEDKLPVSGFLARIHNTTGQHVNLPDHFDIIRRLRHIYAHCGGKGMYRGTKATSDSGMEYMRQFPNGFVEGQQDMIPSAFFKPDGVAKRMVKIATSAKDLYENFNSFARFVPPHLEYIPGILTSVLSLRFPICFQEVDGDHHQRACCRGQAY